MDGLHEEARYNSGLQYFVKQPVLCAVWMISQLDPISAMSIPNDGPGRYLVRVRETIPEPDEVTGFILNELVPIASKHRVPLETLPIPFAAVLLTLRKSLLTPNARVREIIEMYYSGRYP